MDKTNVRELQDVVIRFSGDSGDGMQLTGTLFSDTSALLGNGISSAATGSSTPATTATCWWR